MGPFTYVLSGIVVLFRAKTRHFFGQDIYVGDTNNAAETCSSWPAILSGFFSSGVYFLGSVGSVYFPTVQNMKIYTIAY
ncbi:hypothetical protein PanWU01x14_049790 [Parasponia andersonii]|uniref:Uncharacterized protein n=1 Tax=Parasponia andersonii TaxID=3476 RepID=A0A2P5DMP7_PARAD|nr:hypothetical protein PanWU01x14_049790 [Parasponia andersonii]